MKDSIGNRTGPRQRPPAIRPAPFPAGPGFVFARCSTLDPLPWRRRKNAAGIPPHALGWLSRGVPPAPDRAGRLGCTVTGLRLNTKTLRDMRPRETRPSDPRHGVARAFRHRAAVRRRDLRARLSCDRSSHRPGTHCPGRAFQARRARRPGWRRARIAFPQGSYPSPSATTGQVSRARGADSRAGIRRPARNRRPGCHIARACRRRCHGARHAVKGPPWPRRP